MSQWSDCDDERVGAMRKIFDNSPGLIAIEPGGKDAVEVGAGADEEEDDQQEGLEFEDAEHDWIL